MITAFFVIGISFLVLIVCFFYLYRDNVVSLSTRNPDEKARLQYVRKLSWTLLSGIIIGMLINMVVLPLWLENDITGYPKLMLALSLVAIPLLFIEYYYTRERVIEDVELEISVLRKWNMDIPDELMREYMSLKKKQ